jgi:excisionase family DNA binding protein
MVQYYTLEEAAKLLQVPADQLKEMVKRNEVRAFQDRGTLRFRQQEIDELVRARGLGSDPSLQLGEATKPAGGPPSSGTRRKSKVADEGTPKLADDDKVSLGEPPPTSAKKSGFSSGSGSVGKRKTMTSKTPAPRSPYPKGASDSDVRLVADPGDLDFHLEADDAAKAKSPEAPKSGTRAPEPPRSGTKAPQAPKSPSPRKSQLPPAVSDSQVPTMPELASDSDVKLEGGPPGGSVAPVGQEGAKAPSDSDIRLEDNPPQGPGSGKKRNEGLITEEIDLDAEAANLEAARKKSKMDKAAKPPSTPPLPTSSPFELSESDLDMEPAQSSPTEKKQDSSGDFELTAPDDSSPLELGSDEVAKLPAGSEDEVTLGELTGAGAGASGINIQDLADSGISLEGSEDEIEFDLSLDAGATPKPAQKGTASDVGSSEFELSLPDEEGLTKKTTDSDSEFELSVEDESPAEKPPDSDSEFELTLDEESSSDLEGAGHESSSDSEFELTLDEEGGLTALDESSSATGEEEGKDIFETDFDVPALDEESGSEAVGTEGTTDLEDSEFELDLESGEDTASEDFAADAPVEDEEDVAPPPKRKTRVSRLRAADEEDEEGLDVSLEPDEEEEEEVEPEAAATAAAAPAPVEWGPWPAVFLLPCVIVLIVVGLMGFELIQGMWGFHKQARVSSLIIDPIARIFDDSLPKE